MPKSLTRAAIVVTALVVGGGAVVYSRYSKDINAARARISSGSQIVNTACGPIEYGEYGNGPPLLVVHGSGGGFDQALDFARTLIPHGYRVIAPSRFGYLRTPLPANASPFGLEPHQYRSRFLVDAHSQDPVTAVFCHERKSREGMQGGVRVTPAVLRRAASWPA